MPPKLTSIPVLNTTKKRRIGSGEVAAEDLPSIENAFNNILDTIHAISTGKLEDIQDLHNIKIGVIQALVGLYTVAVYTAPYPSRQPIPLLNICDSIESRYCHKY